MIPEFKDWWLDLDAEEAGMVTSAGLAQGIRGILFDHAYNETIPTFPDLVLVSTVCVAMMYAQMKKKAMTIDNRAIHSKAKAVQTPHSLTSQAQFCPIYTF